MIESRQDILHLLKEYIDTDHEYESQYLNGEDHPKWSIDRQVMYQYGIVVGKFLEEDNDTMITLKRGVSDEALYNEINEYCKRKIRTQNELVNKEPNQRDIIKKAKLEGYKREFQDLKILPIDEWIKKYCSWIHLRNEVENLSDQELRVLLFLDYSFGNYKAMLRSPYNSDTSCLKEMYKNIFYKDSELHTYGIIPIDQHRMLFPIKPPHIYDSSINKTFIVKNIPLQLLKILSNMKRDGLINKLAVRLFNNSVYDGCKNYTYYLEELERGKLFNLVNLGKFSVSKLYSINNYEDNLWVIIDPENITFEELCDDFEDYNNMIVTQVVHLQYENLERECYITHLDHEYVFYTLDEYEKRRKDVQQKGEAQKRLKSFKIDNSKIPFTFSCEIHRKDENGNDSVEKEQFLCYVLECYFKHKDLLREYFQKVKP